MQFLLGNRPLMLGLTRSRIGEPSTGFRPELTVCKWEIQAMLNRSAEVCASCALTTGYRMYTTRCGPVLVVLLYGSSKSTQQADILKARELAANLDIK